MARSFNGTSDMIVVDGAHLFSTGVASSFAFWINAAAQVGRCIYSEGNSSVSTQQFSIDTQSVSPGNTCRFLIVTGGSVKVDNTGSAVICDSTWHHVAITLNTSRNWVRYVDGATDGSGTYSIATAGFNVAAMGVLRRNTNTLFFAGSLAHMANWTRTLSATEAATLAAGLSPSHLGPDHYWPLFGVDSPELDLGNGTHVAGTLTGTSAAAEAKVGSGLLVLGG